jgi:hypothetical protein
MPRIDDADLEKTQAPRSQYPRDFEVPREVQEKLMAERMQSQVGAMQACERDPLDDFFRYHPPSADDLPKYAAINQAAKNFAEVLRANCPTFSQDYRDAIRKLREARMMANSAVALRGRGI